MSSDFKAIPVRAALVAVTLCSLFLLAASAQDPATLVYSTQLGGDGYGSEFGRRMTIDEDGCIYLVSYVGPFVNSPNPSGFLWLAKLDPSKNGPDGDASIVWTTGFVGGEGARPHDIVAGGGFVYVSGWAIDNQLGRGNVFKPTSSTFRDGFVAMFRADTGERTATTYLSKVSSQGADIDPLCMHLVGDALYVGGSLNGDALYLKDAFYPSFDGGRTAFTMRLRVTAPDVIDLVWSSYLPGNAGWEEVRALAGDGAGNLYAAGFSDSGHVNGFPAGGWQAGNAGGSDAVVFRVQDGGSIPALVGGTYLGGTKADVAETLSLAPNGDVWIAGSADSSDLPTTAGAWDRVLDGKRDGFVARFDATLGALAMASYFGGNNQDECQGLVFHGGVVYLAGETRSTDLPTAGALSGGSSSSGREDAFLARIDADAWPLHLTYLGGNKIDNAIGGLEVDADGRAVVGGRMDSNNFSHTSPTSYGGTNYVAVVSFTTGPPPPPPAPGPTITEVTPDFVDAGSSVSVTITGSGFDAGATVSFENGSGPAPSARNVQVSPSGDVITATVNAGSGGPRGTRAWDLRVTNPDTTTAVLGQGFRVIK